MFHFLLILDDDPNRLESTSSKASSIMGQLAGVTAAASIKHPHMTLLTCGNDRHVDKAPMLSNNDWRLGIGSWTGPKDPPTVTDLQAAGEEPLSRYDNAFCFLAGSLAEANAYAMVDPIGRMHAYHAHIYPTARLVSNSALLLAALTGAEWNPISIREFLAKGTVFDDRSLFLGINKLAPNLIYRFSPTRLETYELRRTIVDTPDDLPGSLTAFEQAMTEALSDALESCHHPLLDITGGFDSRLMLASLMQLRPSAEISTVVVGNDTDRDVVVANKIARKFGLRHTQVRPPDDTELTAIELDKALTLTDAEFDIVEYSKVMRVHESLSTDFDLSINGSGGEMIRDEWWQLFMRPLRANPPWDSMRLAARRFATDSWGETMLANKPEDTLSRHFADVIEKTVHQLKGADATRLVDEIYLYLRMQRWQGRISSATHGIWPNHSPLLARKPIAIALHLPIAARRNALMPRLLLERMNPELASLPMVDGAPASPFRWRNGYRHLPRHWSRLKYYTNAVHKRVRSKLPLPSAIIAPTAPPEFLQALLIPEDMYSASLYEASALESACRAFSNGQLPNDHAGRMLTLEYAARTLKKLMG